DMPGIEEDVSNTPSMVILGARTGALTIVGTLIGVLLVSAIHMLIARIALSTLSSKRSGSLNSCTALITALGVRINSSAAAVDCLVETIVFNEYLYCHYYSIRNTHKRHCSSCNRHGKSGSIIHKCLLIC